MEQGEFVCKSLSQVRSSLDELQSVVQNGDSNQDSLRRLRQALLDINEEVNLLKNVIQLDVHKISN